MRTPVQEALSYGIRHIHCGSIKHKVILHWITINMPYPVWKCITYGSTHPPYCVRLYLAGLKAGAVWGLKGNKIHLWLHHVHLYLRCLVHWFHAALLFYKHLHFAVRSFQANNTGDFVTKARLWKGFRECMECPSNCRLTEKVKFSWSGRVLALWKQLIFFIYGPNFVISLS